MYFFLTVLPSLNKDIILCQCEVVFISVSSLESLLFVGLGFLKRDMLMDI